MRANSLTYGTPLFAGFDEHEEYNDDGSQGYITTKTTKVLDASGRTRSITTETIRTLPDGSNVHETTTRDLSRPTSRNNSLRTGSLLAGPQNANYNLDKIDEDLHDFDYNYLDHEPGHQNEHLQHPPTLNAGNHRAPQNAHSKLAPAFEPGQYQQNEHEHQAQPSAGNHPYAELRPQQPYAEERLSSLSSTSSQRRLKSILKNNQDGSKVNSPTSVDHQFRQNQNTSPAEELRDFAAHKFASPGTKPSGGSITSGGNSIKFLETVETIPHTPRDVGNGHSIQLRLPKTEPVKEPKGKPTDLELYENAMKVAMAKVYGNKQNEANSLSTPPQSPTVQQTGNVGSVSSNENRPEDGINPNYTYKNHHREFAIHSLRDGGSHTPSTRKERAKEEKRLQKEEEKRQAELNKAVEKERKKEEKKKDKKPFAGLFSSKKKRRDSRISEDSASQQADYPPEVLQEAERRADEDVGQRVSESNPVSPVEQGIDNPGVLIEANNRAREQVQSLDTQPAPSAQAQSKAPEFSTQIPQGEYDNLKLLAAASERAENRIQSKIPEDVAASALGGGAVGSAAGVVGSQDDKQLNSAEHEINPPVTISDSTNQDAAPLANTNESVHEKSTGPFEHDNAPVDEPLPEPNVTSLSAAGLADKNTGKNVNDAGFAGDAAPGQSLSPEGILGTPLEASGKAEHQGLSLQPGLQNPDAILRNDDSVPPRSPLRNSRIFENNEVPAVVGASGAAGVVAGTEQETKGDVAPVARSSYYDNEEEDFHDSSSDFVDVPEFQDNGAGQKRESKLLSEEGYQIVLKKDAQSAETSNDKSIVNSGFASTSQATPTTPTTPAAANVTTPVPRDVNVPDGPLDVEVQFYEAGLRAGRAHGESVRTTGFSSQPANREEAIPTIVAGSSGKPEILDDEDRGYKTLDPASPKGSLNRRAAYATTKPVGSDQSLKSALLVKTPEQKSEGLGIRSGDDAVFQDGALSNGLSTNGATQNGSPDRSYGKLPEPDLEQPAQFDSLNAEEPAVVRRDGVPGTEEPSDNTVSQKSEKPKKRKVSKFKKMINKYFINSYDKQGR